MPPRRSIPSTPELSEKKNILLSGVAGTFIVLITDVVTNETPTAFKAGGLLSKHLGFGQSTGSFNLIMLLIILLVGFVVCWIYQPKSRVDAFIRGMSVFAILSFAPATDPKKSQPTDNNNKSVSQVNPAEIKPNKVTNNSSTADKNLTINYVSFDVINDNLRHWILQIPAEFKPNATIINNEWISKTKPKPSFMSIFTNTVAVEKIEVKNGYLHLSKGTKVQILEEYNTPLRGYHYVSIRFYQNKELMTGWVYSGKKPDVYLNVIPDKLF